MNFRKSLSLGLCAFLCSSVLFTLPVAASEKKEEPAKKEAGKAEKKPEKKEGGEKKEGEKKGSGNEIVAKVPANYIQLKHMRLTLPEDSSSQYRQLEFEAWISAAGEEHTALLNSNKKKINDFVKEDFANYRWEAFAKPDTGMDVAKQVVAHAVERAVGIKPDEVIMKTLLLR